MNIEKNLDYEKIPTNEGRDLHLVLNLTAPRREAAERKPIAFTVVLDRSGSMQGQPLHHARLACERVIQNLRPEDLFSLVVFDDEANVVIPHAVIGNRNQLIHSVRGIQTRGCTNLTGGWMRGRDELKHTPVEIPRRLLLLSDGLLNRGITESHQVLEIVKDGYAADGIRTSCLGFGDHYNEELLSDIATATHGSFYDVKSEDNLPTIFAAELEGLQEIATHNLRIGVRPGTACSAWTTLDNLPQNPRGNGYTDVSVGDLLSEEKRGLIFRISTKALNLTESGEPDPELLSLKFEYDELKDDKLVSRTRSRIIRLKVTSNPDEVVLNHGVLAPLSIQLAGYAIKKAYELRKKGQIEEAKALLHGQINELRAHNDPATDEATRTLFNLLQRLEEWSLRDQKMAVYSSRSYRRYSSKEAWSSEDMPSPSFKQ